MKTVINPINAMVYVMLYFGEYTTSKYDFRIDCVEIGDASTFNYNNHYNVFFSFRDELRPDNNGKYHGCMTVWVENNKLYGEW